MEIRLLEQLFKQGTLLSAKVLPVPMSSSSYTMTFKTASGSEEQITRTLEKDVKHYKQVNGALKDAKRIGFREVTVDISNF